MAQNSLRKSSPSTRRSNKKILVSGSIAYDFIMKYDGLFKDALLKDHLHNLNVAFTAKTREMYFGGCSPNIAYGIKLLGGDPLIYGVAGNDFSRYTDRLADLGIDTNYIGISEDFLTASAHILTDKKGNQITIFSPGAMTDDSCDPKLIRGDLADVERAILSPDTCSRTVRLAKVLIGAGVPYIFDPGQMTPAFKLNDLRFLLGSAEGFIANEYEVKLLCKRLGVSTAEISSMIASATSVATSSTTSVAAGYFIETRGEKGSILRYGTSDSRNHDDYSHINRDSREIFIPAVRAKKVIDPTGCGDAFRAGFLTGLSRGYTLERACELGAELGARAVESQGTQNYSTS
ncbi:carbohydrate kinase family protein [bacterium]|nr:carbohydrate kinase family protein [bacterium]